MGLFSLIDFENCARKHCFQLHTFRESQCLSLKFVVNASISSSAERSLSRLFEDDGCIVRKEEDWGAIMEGADTTLRAMGVPRGDDDEVLGVEGSRYVLLSSHDIVSEYQWRGCLLKENVFRACPYTASFMRSDLTDSST